MCVAIYTSFVSYLEAFMMEGTKESEQNDVGGFKVTSSRVPDTPPPNISSLVTTKGMTKNLAERQR